MNNKRIYWISTGLLAALMVFSALSYLFNDEMKKAFTHLGFAGYFRVELAIAKLLGAIVLLLPFLPRTLRQFAYGGFAITFLSAFIAHLSAGDGMKMAVMPLLVLVILLVSYLNQDKRNPRLNC